ncbi:MAG: hypothetical protein ABC596_06950 [Candidatus Methanosuratincola petrocarbonis]
MGDIFVFTGKIEGTTTGGTLALRSDWVYDSVTQVKIPSGVVAKIWGMKIEGDGETLAVVEHSKDGGETFVPLIPLKLGAKGHVELENTRRPYVIVGKDGNDVLQVTWEQPSAAKAFVTLTVEFAEAKER